MIAVVKSTNTSLSLDFNHPAIGAFVDVKISDYHGEAFSYAYSKSDLDAVEISPASLIQKRRGPKTESKDLLYGNVFHAAMQFYDRPDEFKKVYAAAIKGTTKEAKEAKAQQLKEAAESGVTFVDPDILEEVLEQKVPSVEANPEACDYLRYPGVNEETLVWKDRETGIILKCRPDRRLTESPRGMPANIVIDWKTISVPQGKTIWQAIENAVESRRYHVQAAMTIDGIKAVHGIEVGMFINCFVQKGDNNNVLCVFFNKKKIDEGRQLFRANLATLSHCIKTNVWSGLKEIGTDWKEL